MLDRDELGLVVIDREKLGLVVIDRDELGLLVIDRDELGDDEEEGDDAQKKHWEQMDSDGKKVVKPTDPRPAFEQKMLDAPCPAVLLRSMDVR